MNKPKILVSYRIPLEGLQDLKADYELIYPDKEKFTVDELVQYAPEVVAIISVFGHKMPNEVIDNAPNVKLISNYGAGFDNIDIKHVSQKGILVTNTAGPVTEPTAELTVGLALSLLRRISELNLNLRTGKDVKWGVMENIGWSLNNKKVGIVGLGKIGLSAAKKFQAFGAQIKYYKRERLSKEVEEELSVDYMSFRELISTCDLISLHMPLNEQTRHLINKEMFDLMKDEAFVVNTARGAVIDEKALVNALQEKKIKGAALDVYEFEPEISKELLAFDNVVLVPHVGTATIETRIEIGEVASRNIIDFFNGTLTKNKVNDHLMKN